MKKYNIVVLLIACVILFTCCVPAKKITYKTNTFTKYPEQLHNVTIAIRPFEDIRFQSEINTTHLQANGCVAKINRSKQCINAEKFYKTPVGTQMANIFAQHLKSKGYFHNVYIGDTTADYYMTAKLDHLYGMQEFSNAAQAGASFGLIGALATMNLTSRGKIAIELSNICVYDKNDKRILEMPNF